MSPGELPQNSRRMRILGTNADAAEEVPSRSSSTPLKERAATEFTHLPFPLS
jgi:hypothetical protein